MQAYYVEGIYAPKKALKKLRSAKITAADLEPYARTVWAESAEGALQQATEDLHGGQWVEGPRIARKSEEQRMRQQGMPELFDLPRPKPRKK